MAEVEPFQRQFIEAVLKTDQTEGGAFSADYLEHEDLTEFQKLVAEAKATIDPDEIERVCKRIFEMGHKHGFDLSTAMSTI